MPSSSCPGRLRMLAGDKHGSAAAEEEAQNGAALTSSHWHSCLSSHRRRESEGLSRSTKGPPTTTRYQSALSFLLLLSVDDESQICQKWLPSLPSSPRSLPPQRRRQLRRLIASRDRPSISCGDCADTKAIHPIPALLLSPYIQSDPSARLRIVRGDSDGSWV